MEGLLKRDEEIYGGITTLIQPNPASNQSPISELPADQQETASNPN